MARVGTVSGNWSNENRSTSDLPPFSLKEIQENQIQDSANNHQEESRDFTRNKQLAQSKASRTQAENARQKIANEILEATKEVCQKLITDGEQSMQRAKKLESEARRKQQQAHEELKVGQSCRKEAEAYASRVKADAQKQAQEQLDQAKQIVAEAQAYRERVMSEVQQEAQKQLNRAQNIRTEADLNWEKVILEATCQSQEILYLARSAAEQECDEMKNHAHLEVQRKMAESELVKAAAQEELETEKIYAETARLEVESLQVLSQARANLADPVAFLRHKHKEVSHVQLKAE